MDLEVEQEHGKADPKTDVINSDPVLKWKIDLFYRCFEFL